MLNLWNLCGILANLFINQISKTVAKVVYDRELFNYEDYYSKGISNEKTLVKLILSKGGSGKQLVADYLKSTKELRRLLTTPEEVGSFLS